MSERLVVDWVACDGRGLCVELVPELLTADDWGYPVARVRRAVAGRAGGRARDTPSELCGSARRWRCGWTARRSVAVEIAVDDGRNVTNSRRVAARASTLGLT